MKQLLIFGFIIGITSSGFAQREFNSKFSAIPPLNTGFKAKKNLISTKNIPEIVAPNVFKSPDIFNSKPIQNNKYQLGVKNNFSLVPKNEFANPNSSIVEKFNKKEDNNEGIVYRKNQNLGDFRSKSLTAKVLYRDAEYVDGDAIRVYLNDKVIESGIILDGNFQGFEITLVNGFNKIDFEALNQGSSGPNTAEFQVYDDKGILISANKWNLGTGFKATIIITKE